MKLLVPVLAALLAACSPKSTPPPPPGPTGGLGEAVLVNGLRLRPTEVVEDSRCPSSVQCVWAGRVRLSVRIGAPDGSGIETRELTLGEPASVHGGTLTLVNVEPEKKFAGSVEAEAYRFTFTYAR
jgi:hypothetical protein